MTQLDKTMVAIVKKIAIIDWQERHPVPAWFTLTEPCDISKMDSDDVLKLIKARNEGFIRLYLNVNLATLWHHAKSLSTELNISNEVAFEQYWLTAQHHYLRRLLHELKLVAEQRFINELDEKLPVLKTLPLTQQQNFLILEPGIRSGIKLLAANAGGDEVSHSIVFPHEPQNQWQQGIRKLNQFCQTTKIQQIVLLQGEGYVESRRFLKEWLNGREDTLSVYHYDAQALDVLCARESDVLDDSLHFRVRQAARILTSPKDCFQKVPLQCLIQDPLKTTINPWQLECALRAIWQKKIVVGETLTVDALAMNSLMELNDLSSGQSIQGRVINITDFGYFLDIGLEINGLLHNSQLNSGRTFVIGELVDVYIDKINQDKSQFSLSLKKTRPKTAKFTPKKAAGKPKRKPAPGNSAMADALKAALNKKQ